MAESTESFASWAIIELLGHKRLAGFVGEQVIAGVAFLRVDVPETQYEADTRYGAGNITTTPSYTKFVGPSSVYCITPCTEEVSRSAARELERWNDPIPVELPKLLPAGAVVDTGEDLPF